MTLTPQHLRALELLRPILGWQARKLFEANGRSLQKLAGYARESDAPACRRLLTNLALARELLAEELAAGLAFDAPAAVRDYLVLHFAGQKHKSFAVLYLDAQHRLIAFKELFRGTLTQTSVYPRELVRRSMVLNAAALIVSHNHERGGRAVACGRAADAVAEGGAGAGGRTGAGPRGGGRQPFGLYGGARADVRPGLRPLPRAALVRGRGGLLLPSACHGVLAVKACAPCRALAAGGRLRALTAARAVPCDGRAIPPATVRGAHHACIHHRGAARAAGRQRAGSQAREDFDPLPVLKLFTPDAGATWLLSEIDPQNADRAFGLCDLGLGFPELGWVSMAELDALRGTMGRPIEQDVHFRPEKRLSVYAQVARAAGRIQA